MASGGNNYFVWYFKYHNVKATYSAGTINIEHDDVGEIHYKISYYLKVVQNYWTKNRIYLKEIRITTKGKVYEISKEKFSKYLKSNSDQQILIIRSMVNEGQDISISKEAQD